MAALAGLLDEWVQREDGRWHRPDHPEDGVITLREGLTFNDYYAKRAEPEPLPPPGPIRAELDALKARLDAVETKAESLTASVVELEAKAADVAPEPEADK